MILQVCKHSYSLFIQYNKYLWFSYLYNLFVFGLFLLYCRHIAISDNNWCTIRKLIFAWYIHICVFHFSAEKIWRCLLFKVPYLFCKLCPFNIVRECNPFLFVSGSTTASNVSHQLSFWSDTLFASYIQLHLCIVTVYFYYLINIFSWDICFERKYWGDIQLYT